MTDTIHMKQRLLYSLLAIVLFSHFSVAAQVLSESESDSPRFVFMVAARKYLGVPYRSGGSTLRGMDCSGLVFRAAIDGPGLSVPRTVQALSDRARHVPDSAIEPGDLLFFNTTGRISHVGIYIGNNRFIHAASEGPSTGVIISELSESYWKRTYRFAGSILDSEPENFLPEDEPFRNSEPRKSRATPFTGDIGFRLNITGGVLWDIMPGEQPIRGGSISSELAWVKHPDVYPGLGGGIVYDHRTGSLSIPLFASIAMPSGFRFFVGTQYHIRADNDLDRELQFPGIIGFSWSSRPANLLGQAMRFYQSAEYSWFPGETFGLGFRFNTGLTLSYDF